MAGDDGLGDAFYEGHAETDFTGYSVSHMKKMLDEVNFAEGGRVSHAWLTVRNSLAGEDGEGRAAGSIAGDLRKAVRDVKDHWHGPAAEAFERAAENLAKDFVHAAAQAKDASDAVECAFQELRTTKDVLDDLAEPGVLARAGDYLSDLGSRNDSGLNEDVNDPARIASLEETTEKNEGDLSAGKEYQMRGAAALTRLAGAYRVQANRMDGIRADRVDSKLENPGAEGGAGAGGAVPAPVIVAPVPRGDSPARTSRTPTAETVPSPASKAPQNPSPTGPAPSGTDIDAAHPSTATKQLPGDTPAASRPSGPQPGASTGPGGPEVVQPGIGAGPGSPGRGGGPGSPGRTTPGTPAPQQGGSNAARGGAPGTPGTAGTAGTHGTPVSGAAGAAGAAGGSAGERTKQPRGRPRFVRPSDEKTPEKPKPVSRAGQLNTPGGTGLGTRGRGMRTDAKQKQEEEDAQRDQTESPDSAVDDQGTWTPRRRNPQTSDETGTE